MSDISNILYNWYETKKDIASLERKQQKYKQIITRYLDNQGSNTVSNSRYVLVRRYSTRETIKKSSVPPDVWRRYSVRTRFPSFYISEKRVRRR
jgi:hypothetical protein